MRWIARLIIFASALALGTTVWYVLAQNRTSAARDTNMNVKGEGQPATEEIKSVSQAATSAEDEAQAVASSVKWATLTSLGGYANAKQVALHSHGEADSPVVATIYAEENDAVEILDSTRDFLLVKFPADGGIGDGTREHDYKGWVKWGVVMPYMTAIVLDAETGETVGRVPLAEDMSSVTYSPDGKRALFHYGRRYGDFERPAVAYEVDTQRYTLMRTLEATGRANSRTNIGELFYGPSDGHLYAPVWDFDKWPPPRAPLSVLDFVRVGEGGSAGERVGAVEAGSRNFAVSPDGLTGFVVRKKYDQTGAAVFDAVEVDVIDLKTLSVRHSFALDGIDSYGSDALAISRDGTKLFLKNSGNTGDIVVIDARTGRRVRDIPFRYPQDHWAGFSQNSLVGDSLLVTVWQPKDEHSGVPYGVWLEEGKQTVAGRKIAFALEANGRRYAVNASGTHLFKLDKNNRIHTKIKIARPDIRFQKTIDDHLTVQGFAASPDGKHLIVFVGTVHGC